MPSIFKSAGPLEIAIRNVLAVGEELREIHVILSKIPKQEAEARCRKEAIDRSILGIRKSIRLLQLQLDAIGKLTKPKA